MDFKSLSEYYETEYIEKVQELLKIPSVYEEDSNFPYGRQIHDALETMLRIAEEDGFLTKNVDGHGGHVEYGQGEEIIGVLGHLDVVPAGSGWTTPPFEPVIKEGKLYARGAQDDKGPVMAAYMAMKLLKDQGFEPKKKIRLILGTDEERDWKGIDYYFKKEQMPSVGFTPDASFPVIHAEKGLLDGYITLPVPKEKGAVSILSVEGGDRLNMVPDVASAKVVSSQDIEEMFHKYLDHYDLRGSIETMDGHFQIVLHGEPVHASKPDDGVNAVTALLGFLETLPLSDSEKSFVTVVSRALETTDGRGLNLNMEDDVSGPLTFNLGSIEMDESSGRFGINLRYPVRADFNVIEQSLKNWAAELGGTYETYDHLSAIHLEMDHPFVETLLSVYNHVTGEDREAISIGGATYARSLNAGVAFGAMFDGSPDTAHQKDEHVKISDMIRAVEIYAHSLYVLTK